MKKAKTTKRALLSGVLALLLCVSSFVGTTFAWFTDSVTSANNVITAGNLDLEVEYTLDGETWADLDGAKDLFSKGLWEPGHTEVVALKVTNAGSLALKYEASMNVAAETIGKTKDGKDIKLSDILTVSTLCQAANDVGEIALYLAYTGENSVGYENTATFADTNVMGKAAQELFPGDAHYVIVKVDMADTVGNEANHDGVNVPTIEFGINVVATQYTHENDSFNNQYDKDATMPIVVKNHDEAQAALDTLKSGSTLQLVPGADYGTLEVRANVGAEKKKPVILSDNTVAADYYTTKYPTGEFVRTFDNITILGAPGATVDAINFVNGTHKAPGADGTTTGTIYRFVKVSNLVIDGVEFTDKSAVTPDKNWYSPILFNLPGVQVDGLTVKNCKLVGNNSKMNFVYAYGTTAKDCTFEATFNNINIVNNTVSGIARLCELREAENVTITGNTVNNLVKEVALLANNGTNAYSGTISITDNTADTFGGFFAVVGVGGDASIIVENNDIANCGRSAEYPEYADIAYASVRNHTGSLTVSGNTVR